LTIAFFVALTFHEPRNGKKESKRYIEIVKDGFHYLKNSKVLKILAIDLTIIAAVGYFMIWLYQPMLKQAGISIGYFGLVHSALVLMEILVMNNYGRLEKLFGSKKGLIFFSAAITGLMFLVAGLTRSIPLVLLSIVIGGGFGLSRGPLFSSYMNKYIPSSKRATVMSTINMFRRFLIAVLNPFVGLLVDWNLSYTLIILGAIALIFTLCSRVEEKYLKD
jgi:MFS family permease